MAHETICHAASMEGECEHGMLRSHRVPVIVENEDDTVAQGVIWSCGCIQTTVGNILTIKPCGKHPFPVG